MGSGIDSGTAAVIGAAVGAAVSLSVAIINRVLDAVHNSRERKQANRLEIREALTELNRSLLTLAHSSRGEDVEELAATVFALTRLELILPTKDAPMVSIARDATVSARFDELEVWDDRDAVGSFRALSSDWYRGVLSARDAERQYMLRVHPPRFKV